MAFALIIATPLGFTSDSAFGQVTTHEPYVLVDIGEFIDAAEDMTVTLGEAHDVNDDGYVVGYYMDDSDDSIPFVLDPTDGGSLMTVNMTGYDEASMLAINSPDPFDLDDVVIAGWIVDDSAGASGKEPAYWTWDSTNKEWDASLVSAAPRIVGSANAVNIDGDLTGAYINSGVNNIFYYDFSAQSWANWGDGTGYGINDSGWVCGKDINDSKAFAQKTSNLNSRVHLRKSGHTSSEAYAINNDGHVVGWSLSNPAASKRVWLWRYETTTWDTTGEELSPLPSSYVNAEANAINDADPFEVIGNYNVPEIEGGFYTLEYSSTWESINLDGHTLFPVQHLTDLLDPDTPDPVVDRCYGINNLGWIAGSFEPIEDDTPESYRPCVLIQNDMDNDGAPDLREIFTDEEADSNDDKLIDWAEDMRCGLFAPGSNGESAKTRNIDNVQVVRLMNYHQNRIHCLVGGNELTSQECANWETDCDDHAEWYTKWGGDDEHDVNDKRAEIIINFRTIDPGGAQLNPAYPYDYLAPDDLDPNDGVISAPEIERDLGIFCYRFARCIDGFQAGNEIYTGPGRYYFYTGDLPDTGYTGVFRNIDELDEIDEATAAIFAQLMNQIEAARRGSALAGRPLRMFGPSISGGTVRSGFCGTIDDPTPEEKDLSALAIKNCVDFVNARKLIFDQHIYYDSLETFQDTIKMITNDCNGCSGDCSGVSQAPWGDGPDQIACLEYGPIPNRDTGEWWDTNVNTVTEFFESGTIDCASSNDHRWTEFVNDWWDDPNEWDNDFHLDDVLSDFDTYGFRYAAINAIQLGLQGTSLAKPTDVAALRAQEIYDWDCIEDRTNQFMPIAYDLGSNEDYEAEAQTYMISNFNPHPDECDCETACPDDDCDQ